MEFLAEGSATTEIGSKRLHELLEVFVTQLGQVRRVLLLPPDITRKHSGAGEIACILHDRLTQQGAEVWVLPTIGTHFPMTEVEKAALFPSIPADRFLVHEWRRGIEFLGEIPAEFIHDVSEGRLNYPIRIELSRHLFASDWDAILSIGQLVPHEVIGIANHNKNVFVGAGGADIINRTHYLGAVYGMERIMGRARSPVRDCLNWAEKSLAGRLPIRYVLTVRGRSEDGRLVTRGLFAGDDDACFLRGAELVRRVNLDLLDHAPQTVVVYLDPEEFKTTWLGNKAIYRTRMAIADGGNLIILAPGVHQFGEDPEIDRLIRAFGYRGTPATLAAVDQHAELGNNLSAAAHLIHGSSEGRFRTTYCPGQLSREEVEGVGFEYADLATMLDRYPPEQLVPGWNHHLGEEVFFVPNPGLGLWGTPDRFATQSD